MNDVLTSISSVVLRTLPNLLLLLVLTQTYELLQVGDALFAITICSLLATFVDFGLNDVFNHQCATKVSNVQKVFTRFYRFRFSNGVLLYITLISLYPLFTSKELYFFIIAYFPCSFVFQFQVLAMSSIRYTDGFDAERSLQVKLSIINIVAILVLPLVIEISLFEYLICLSIVRVVLFALTVIGHRELLRIVSYDKWSMSWHKNFLKDNSGWFLSHSLAVLYMNIDSLVLVKLLPETDFAIYQVVIRLFITSTMISMAINAITSKKLAPAVHLDNTSFNKVLIPIIFQASALYFGIACILVLLSPSILHYLLAIPSEYIAGKYIFTLVGIFFFRVVSNIFDSIYASLERSIAKLYSHLFSIFLLLIILFICNPNSVLDALYVVLTASIFGLFLRVWILIYYMKVRGGVQHG